jgi:L-threonylcarbamoyladenylate synthase
MAECRPAFSADGRVDAGLIREAAARLAAGEPVAFPTETVYGLGASTTDPEAIARIYALKGRPSDNPLIAHVAAADPASLRSLTTPAAADDPRVAALAAAFWPGPLTLVLPRGAGVPAVATGGRDSVAVRCPRHPVAAALLEAFGGPVSAPSANVSGHVSPTTAAHVAAEFAASDLLVLDGGPCPVGLESTVLQLTSDPPRILRPGAVTAAMLEPILGPVAEPRIREQAASPGTSRRHYAPRQPILAAESPAEAAAVVAAGERCIVVGEPAAIEGLGVAAAALVPIGPGAAAWSRELYAAVRLADERVAAGEASRILLVRPAGRGGDWDAVHDRIDRMVAD